MNGTVQILNNEKTVFVIIAEFDNQNRCDYLTFIFQNCKFVRPFRSWWCSDDVI